MSARAVPTMPTWSAGQQMTSTLMNQITTYTQFWANPPMFRMRQTVVQLIPNATFTQVICDNPDYDSDSGRALGTPWSYTIPAGMSGRWRFGLKDSFATNASGIRLVQLYKNGIGISDVQDFMLPNGVFPTQVTMTDTVPVAAGDVMSMWCYQSSGGGLNTDTTTPSVFSGQLVSLASP